MREELLHGIQWIGSLASPSFKQPLHRLLEGFDDLIWSNFSPGAKTSRALWAPAAQDEANQAGSRDGE